MKKAISLLFLFCALILPSALFAQNSDNFPYYKIQYTPPDSYNDSLEVFVSIDEERCKEAYKENWYNICANNVGEVGKKVDFITLRPELDGYWEWQNENSLIFRRAANTYWPIAQEFLVNYTDEIVPNHPWDYANSFKFTTPPQAATIENSRLWTDPSEKAKHAFTFSLRFLYPVIDKEKMIEAISFEQNKSNSPLRLGKVEYTWSRNDTYVNINVPVLELPKDNLILTVKLDNVKQFTQHGANKGFTDSFAFQTDITGSDYLFAVNSANLNLSYNKKLEQEYVLTLTTSFQTKASDLAKKLKIYALPKKITEESRQNYNWEQALNLVREEEVAFELVGKASDVNTTHSFKVNAKPETFIAVDIAKDLESVSNLKLHEDKTYVLYANKYEPKISFLQSGNILNLEGERTLHIQTSQLSALKWEAERIRIPYLSMLTNDYFNLGYSSRYDRRDFQNLSDIQTGEFEINGLGIADSKIISLDMSPLLKTDDNANTAGIINLKLKGIQEGKEVVFEEKMVMITDIGLIVKKDSLGKRNVFAYSMSKGTPLSDISVEFLGANGLSITQAKTNKDGLAVLDSVDNFSKDKEAVVLVAYNEKTNDYSFISMHDLHRMVETSSFQIGGRQFSQSPLQGYVFSERGIFRPSDKLNFSAIIRNNDNSLPENQPLKAVLYDPQNIKVFEKNYTLSKEDFGMNTFSWQSSAQAITGFYRLDIMSNNSVIGSTSVSVEEFQPDSMEIKAEISPKKTKGWHVLEENKLFTVEVELDNLYGTGAQNRKIESSLTLNYPNLSFASYPDYIFSDPYASNYEFYNFELPEITTNEDGIARAELNFNSFVVKNATYNATLNVEGFEANGGRSVRTEVSALVSPAKTLIGYKTKGEISIDYIPQSKDAQIEFITIDSDLNQLEDLEYTLVLSERKYIKNLVSNNQNQYSYQDTLTQEEIKSERIKSSKGKIVWDIPTEKVGNYVALIYPSKRDKEAKEFPLAQVPFTVVGNELKLDPQNIPSTLSINVPKREHSSGENIELALALPYDGFGLITLEADKVLSHTWFNAKAGESMQEIEIPKNYEGKAYISVSYLKKINSDNAYLTPLAYSVEPVLVNISKRKIYLELEMPTLYTPTGKGGKIELELFADKDSKAIVFAVDEGILQLNDFASPSPLKYFLEDRALEVSTSMLSELVMQELAKNSFAQMDVMERSAFGGGMMMSKANDLANPFKRKAEPPFVYWSDIIDVSSSGTEIEIEIPSYYNGSLRVMAVAVNKNAFGATNKNVLVKNSLVINPQLPLAVTPGDILSSSIMFANTTDKDQEYTLEFIPSDGLEIQNSAQELPKTLTLLAGEEKNIPINIVVKDVLGEATIAVHASNNSDDFIKETSISIRPSSPYITDLLIGITNKPTTVQAENEFYPFMAKQELSISYAPVPFIQALLNYLDNYPFDCLEQLISTAMPYIVLNAEPTLLYGTKAKPKEAEKDGNNKINEALYTIRTSMIYGQGLPLWKNEYEANDLLTVYTADFFLAMRKAGLLPPVDTEDMLFNTLTGIAAKKPISIEEARITAYAIWVLTREGTITTQYIDNLINNLNNAPKDSELYSIDKDITSIFIAGTLDLLHISGAEEFISNFEQDKSFFNQDSFFDPLAAQAFYVRILAQSFAELLTKDVLEKNIDETLQTFSRGYSTFSASQAISALWELSQLSNNIDDKNITLDKAMLTCANAEASEYYALDNYGIGISSPLCESFTIEPTNDSKIYYQLTNSGYSKEKQVERVSNGLYVEKRLLDIENQPVSNIKIGDVITVEIKANAYGRNLENIVIQDLYAGAFEVVRDERNDTMPIARYSTNLINHKEIREDRALFFTELSTEEYTFTYKLRAISKGTFTVPAVYANSMYDNSLNAHGISSTIVVE